eukprot:1437362-Rhodomonas_salina.2
MPVHSPKGARKHALRMNNSGSERDARSQKAKRWPHGKTAAEIAANPHAAHFRLRNTSGGFWRGPKYGSSAGMQHNSLSQRGDGGFI